jgi:hypothetical protein
LVKFPVNPVFFHVWASLRIELVPIGKDGGEGGRGVQRGGDGGHGTGIDIKLNPEQSYKFEEVTGSLPLFFFVDDPSF